MSDAMSLGELWRSLNQRPVREFAKDLDKLLFRGVQPQPRKDLAKQAGITPTELADVLAGKQLPGRAYCETVKKLLNAYEKVAQPHDGKDSPPSDGDKATGNPVAELRRLRSTCKDLPPARPSWLVPLAVLAVLALLAGLLVSVYRGSAAAVPLPGCSGAATDVLRIAVSQEKELLLAQAAAEYGSRLVNGRCFTVEVKAVNSGDAMEALAGGWDEAVHGQRPDVWSPASSVWLSLGRQRAAPQAAELFPTGDPPSIVRTPLVIAMPEPMAGAVGWPKQDFGWQKLAELSRDGWRRYDHLEWGQFQFGKTNPNRSTSGLIATSAAFAALSGHTGELSAEDVRNGGEQERVREIERSVLHYGDTTLSFLTRLRQADRDGDALSYVSAITLEESSMIAYNRGYPCGALSSKPECAPGQEPTTKLVAMYPVDGTQDSDHPYIEIGRLDETKKAVATDFLNYLHSEPGYSDPGKDAFQAVFRPLGFAITKGIPTRWPAKRTAPIARRVRRSSQCLKAQCSPRFSQSGAKCVSRRTSCWSLTRRDR